MGIVANQSIKNTVITYIGFAIGAINTLFMYAQFLGDTYYGLVGFILSTANILMPIIALGAQSTLIRYYSLYKTDDEKQKLFSFLLILPLLIGLLLYLLGLFFYEDIALSVSKRNKIVYNYVWIIPIIAVFMAYFEVFYAWAKIHYQSVFGNFVKEVLLRILISFFLVLVYFKNITPHQFIYSLLIIYGLCALIMKIYAFYIRFPKFTFKFPYNVSSIFAYSLFIVLSGSIANLMLELDKFMLNFYMIIDNIAYYSVAVFIATVVAVPGRAMHQIVHPITAKLMNDGKWKELNLLYKQTSNTLQVIGGLLFLLIIININQLYNLLPNVYEKGMYVVFIIGISKYIELVLGNNNAIIFNTKYYKTILLLGLFLIVIAIVLNIYFIPKWQINGAAFATFFSILIYSLLKLFFVVYKLKLFPFTKNTFFSFLILLISVLVFYFWNFNYHSIINIILKTVLASIFYLSLHYAFSISLDINNLIDRFIRRK